MFKDKICVLCGRTFTPKGGVAKYCKLPTEKICIVCGKSFTVPCHPKANDVCDNPECKKRAGFVAASKANTHKCRVCGETFIANSSRQLDCGKEITKICEICGRSYKTKCGLRWQGHTCENPKCRSAYTTKSQQAHFLSITRKCSFCGKEFHPVNNKQLICGNPHTVICKTCGKPFEVDAKYRPEEAPKYCSEECKHIGYLNRTPVVTPEGIEKMKQTKIARYGDNYGSIIMEKARKTYQKKTGYAHQIYNPDTHKKRANTRNKISSKTGKSFDSYYETQVYDFIRDITEVNTQIPIKYTYKDKQHTTWIDFKLAGRLFEVKGSHLLSGVYDDMGIPISAKLQVYNDNHVILITNNTDVVKNILSQYNNIIGIDINLFNAELSLQNRIILWHKITLAISQNNKFIDSQVIS